VVGINTEIHNNSLPGEGKIEFLFGRKQNYRQFSFFHCSSGDSRGYYLQLGKGQIFLGRGNWMDVVLPYGCSMLVVSDWLRLQRVLRS